MNSQLNVSYSYADKICSSMIQRNLDILWSDSANLTALDRLLLEKIRRAGCVRFNYGVELASDPVLARIGKNLTVKTAERNLRLAHEAGIWNSVNFIFGMPYETESDVEATLAMIERNAETIDGYAFHRFRVKRNSRFEVEAGGFGIVPRRDPRGRLTGGYDETTGLAWEERERRTDEALRLANELIFSDTCALAQNTHLVFSLYSSLGEKDEVRRWIARLAEANRLAQRIEEGDEAARAK